MSRAVTCLACIANADAPDRVHNYYRLHGLRGMTRGVRHAPVVSIEGPKGTGWWKCELVFDATQGRWRRVD